MELEDELKRFEIGDKLFMYLIDQTEGQTGKAIIAIAYTLANIEAQSPGALALVIEGAELLAKKIKMIEAIVRITELQEAPPPDPKTLN